MNALDVSHAAVEAVERAARSAVVSAESQTAREDRRRAVEALHDQIPEGWAARAHLSISPTGSTIQTFSAAGDDAARALRQRVHPEHPAPAEPAYARPGEPLKITRDPRDGSILAISGSGWGGIFPREFRSVS